jgi:polysaccharide export outer membrane protein
MRRAGGILVHTIAVAAAALTAAAPQAQSREGSPAPAVSGTCSGDYAIGAEDVLEIAVWNNTTITRTVPVRPDGKISLPLVNDLHAAGLTTGQLRESLTKALIPYIPSPSVSVIVREIHSFKVTVMGEVKTPGRYELKDRATVLDVLALAGGLTEYASRGKIVVLRQEDGTTRRLRFAYGSATETDGKPGSTPGQDNFCVKPGDIIVVP